MRLITGGYHYLRLYSLSVKELNFNSESDLLELLHLGGFPEPFFAKNKIEAIR